jgi:Phytanoyl-CoA dioxygenase (PhyH)
VAALAPITARVAARAPGLAAVARRSAWKARNLPRSLAFRADDDAYDRELLAELKERGIAVRPFDAVFRDRSALERLTEAAKAHEGSGSPTKDFLRRLMPASVTLDSPYVTLALEPQVVALANAYLGMRSYLRALDVWLNIPTPDPPKLSQLWHRDYDDAINLKLFVYLSDVDERTGPFTFAPGTQPGGPRQLGLKDRVDDDEMATHVPRDEWVVATGPAGTVVLADTCGYHKGGKPVDGERLLWTAQFTSGAAGAERNFELEGNGSLGSLSRDQRWALFALPLRRS